MTGNRGMIETNRCEDIIRLVASRPGLTVSWVVIDKAWPRSGVKDASEYIAMETNTDLEWDEYGNPRFMPKDPAAVAEIRSAWASVGLK